MIINFKKTRTLSTERYYYQEIWNIRKKNKEKIKRNKEKIKRTKERIPAKS